MTSVLARPRNAATTREAILNAARERFARHSYDDVGVRDIARDAGVDASLISRYFGSKEDLFSAALDSCEAGEDLFDGPRETFGRRIADKVVFDRRPDEKLRRIQLMLLSMGSAKASEIVQASANAGFFQPFAEWLGGPDAAVRVRLIAGLIMGLSISRELADGFGLDARDSELLRDRLAIMIQAVVDGSPT